jgi:MSHA biogenesis protein MshQ
MRLIAHALLAAGLTACLLLSQAAHAQVSQTRSPTAACTNQGGIGTIAWATPGNAVSSNGSYAAATVDGQTTNYLRCLSYGFSIPLNATIVGIVVNVERKSDRTQNGGSEDAAMRLVKAGAIQAVDRSTGTNYTTSDAVEPHGGAADLWGTTWTPAEINAANFGAAFAAVKADSSGQPHDITVDHISITVHYTVPVFAVPGSFNAFETGTAAGAVSGVIVTKVAGTAFSLDVVAITAGAQEPLFTAAAVRVELLGNTALGVALDAQNCPTSFTLLQTVAPDPTITAGRSTVAFAAVPNSWRDVRVRVRYPAGAPTVTSCSTDNFAVRPASFALAASDSNWQSAGTARVLNNTGAAGGTVHKAGRAFRLTVTPAPATTTNYAGDPTPSAIGLACSLPTPCANGTLTLGTFSAAGGGVRVSDTATYSEAGAFNLTLRDETYASVDAADTLGDCTATGRYICQFPAPLAVGRFVPDRFAITAGTAPEMRTFDSTDAACSVPPSGPRRSFTYIGQPFGYVTAPTGTVVAQNATGGTTTNYRGAPPGGLWKLTAAASVSQTFTNTPAKPITPTLGSPTLTEIANSGTGTLSANAADKITFDRDSATPSVPFNADLTLRWSVSDDAENGANQGIITTATPLDFTSIAFDAGNAFRYGRLRLGNANGSHLTPLPVVMEAQYAVLANSFVTNAADNCTTIEATTLISNVAMTFSGNLGTPPPDCKTALSNGGAFTGGRRTLLLAAPLANNEGAATLSINLDGTAGTTCLAVGGSTAAVTSAARPYLQGNWSGSTYTVNPAARATFGTFKGAGEVIFMRENF